MLFRGLLAGLALLGVADAALYTRNSPVLQVDAKSYDKLIAKSNHTSVVEFYAPWCGHCQNLKPAYEKAASNLAGLAQVAAVNCDDDANKPLCATMGVQGFPTLKIVRPGKKTGKPIVDDYNGPRTATGIVEAVVDRINNHVTRVTDKDIDEFLERDKERPKALLFTEKGSTSTLLKSIAIDFLDVISVAQIRSKEEGSVGRFGVEKFPTLVLLPGGDKEAVTYEGEMKKGPIVEFLSQAGEPNPDPAASKSDKKKDGPEEPKQDAPGPEPESQALPKEQAPPALKTLMTTEALEEECLHPRAGTCVLALVPEEKHETADHLLLDLAGLVHKNAQAERGLFPFFAVPAVNPSHKTLVGKLGLEGEVELVAVNAKRGWWRRYEGDFGAMSVADWVDAIRMGEGEKAKLPDGVVKEGHDEL